MRLTDERWEHIRSHPEMADYGSEIERVVVGPDLAVQSRTDPEAILNYRRKVASSFGDKWLCVVVKYLPGDAFVLTAYLTDRPKKGEQVWPAT